MVMLPANPFMSGRVTVILAFVMRQPVLGLFGGRTDAAAGALFLVRMGRTKAHEIQFWVRMK